MSKAKFDKRMCLQCVYHQETTSVGYPIIVKSGKEDRVIHVHCNYIGVTRDSCLQDAGSGRVIDIRGDGPDCKLFKKGAVQKTMTDNIYIGHEDKENIYR